MSPSPSPNFIIDEGSRRLAVILPLLFGILFLLLLILLALYIWRDSGGLPGVWFRFSFSHSNPQISPFYLPADARQRLRDEMNAAKIKRDKMPEYDDGNEQPLLAVVPPDGPGGAFLPEDEAIQPRSANVDEAEAGAGADGAAGAVAACTAAEAAQAASVGTDLGPAGSAKPMGALGEGEEEPPHERARRLEWIKFYVRTGQPEEA